MSEIIQTIARIRRTMPRNRDVMDLCEFAEGCMAAASERAEQVIDAKAHRVAFDKKAYQKEYMRRRRQAEQRAKP